MVMLPPVSGKRSARGPSSTRPPTRKRAGAGPPGGCGVGVVGSITTGARPTDGARVGVPLYGGNGLRTVVIGSAASLAGGGEPAVGGRAAKMSSVKASSAAPGTAASRSSISLSSLGGFGVGWGVGAGPARGAAIGGAWGSGRAGMAGAMTAAGGAVTGAGLTGGGSAGVMRMAGRR